MPPALQKTLTSGSWALEYLGPEFQSPSTWPHDNSNLSVAGEFVEEAQGICPSELAGHRNLILFVTDFARIAGSEEAAMDAPLRELDQTIQTSKSFFPYAWETVTFCSELGGCGPIAILHQTDLAW